MSLFEIGMLICFGAAWPANIAKSLKSKSVEGKSVMFLYVISLGYIFGIIHKLVYDPNFVVFLYGINLSMVVFDMSLYYRNKKRYS